MADSSDIDQAIIALLGSDTELLQLMPNGVYWDEAPQGSTRFVLVSLVDPRDVGVFGGRAYEDILYRVQAVGVASVKPDARFPLPNMKAAALRIDEILDEQTLTVSGYQHMAMFRDDQTTSRVRESIRDSIDPDLIWHYRGAFYRVQQALIPQR